MKRLANTGARGEPIATTSIWSKNEPLNKKCVWAVAKLSGSLSKSGPLDFGTKNNFPSFFVSEKGLVHIYKKAIYYFPVSYFCFATSQNWILAELQLPSVIRKVKFTDFVKRATSPKIQLAEFRLLQILRYIHYFDWQNMETFRKILSLPGRLEDTLLWGLRSPTKI